MEDNKKIIITGQPNRYQIKKLTSEKNIKMKPKIEIEKLNLSSEYFTYDKQLEMIHNFEINNDDTLLLIKQLDKKISSYKQQDTIKNIFDSSKFINLKNVIDKLIETKMKCYYCNCKMSLLYEYVREEKQWTVDRIDNNLGHNNDNFVLACLKCNLKRRRQNMNDFLFTKQLNIIKQDCSNNII